jgi:hypothetical protein
LFPTETFPKLRLVALVESVPAPPELFLAAGPAFVRPTQLESPTVTRINPRVNSAANGRRAEEEVEWVPGSAEISVKVA